MQAPPAQAAKPPHHAIGRRRSERCESDPCDPAHDQINAMRDFVDKLAEVEALIGEKQRKMHRDVTESADAEHPPYIDKIAIAKDPPERRYRQRYAQKHQ